VRIFAAVHESAVGTTRTSCDIRYSVAIEWKADVTPTSVLS
jgi:hypothetical protein